MLPSQAAEKENRPFADRIKASSRSLLGLKDFTLYNMDYPWGAIRVGSKQFEAATVEAIPAYTKDAYTLYFKDELGDELAHIGLPLGKLRSLLDRAAVGLAPDERHHGAELVKRELRGLMQQANVTLPERLLHDMFLGLERHAAQASLTRTDNALSR